MVGNLGNFIVSDNLDSAMITWIVLRGGPNFGPVKYVKEVSHVKHMHANSFLVYSNLSSKLMITWLNPLSVHFQTDKKLTFGPVRTNEGGLKVSFRIIYGHVNVINFYEKLGWIKSESDIY